MADAPKPNPVTQSLVDQAEVGESLPANYEDFQARKETGRRAGVILHVTSLPGPYGIGEIGTQCIAMINWLKASGLKVWSVLPLVPPDKYFSPYSSSDSNCGNILLISIDSLVNAGLLDATDAPPREPVLLHGDFDMVRQIKEPLLRRAALNLLSLDPSDPLKVQLSAWVAAHPWVKDSALFEVIRNLPQHQDKYWYEWEDGYKFKQPALMTEVREVHQQEMEIFIALQFLFDHQWQAVKAYATSQGISILGDLPIYVGAQSADVWAHQHLFELGSDGKPLAVSGVPPDAFSEDGQLWGSPLYNWKAHASQGYQWWIDRMSRAKELYHEVRIDHFRAFAGYWAVDATSTTAKAGTWRKGPGKQLFQALNDGIGDFPIVAENLGVITDDVELLRSQISAPGMVVLQFAWGGGQKNVHLPHMHEPNSVCFPATHDNETTVGWWKDSATAAEMELIKLYLGCDGSDPAWTFIRASMESVAKTALITLQDVLRLDNSARMNTPSTSQGNWTWRMGDTDVWRQLNGVSLDLKNLCVAFDRYPEDELLEPQWDVRGNQTETTNGESGTANGS